MIALSSQRFSWSKCKYLATFEGNLPPVAQRLSYQRQGPQSESHTPHGESHAKPLFAAKHKHIRRTTEQKKATLSKQCDLAYLKF